MSKQEQRAAVVAEVKRRLAMPDAAERLADLVEEWRDRALALMTEKAEAVKARSVAA